MTTPEQLFPVSAYLDLDEYNDHEEKHAYYLQMRSFIVDRIKQFQAESDRAIDVLENGAGTGLLTKHLLAIPGINLTLLEPDERSRPVLRAQLGEQNSHINILEGGAEELDGSTQWDLITSSFSHDHVKDSAKLAASLFSALKVGGIYMAGVEILGDYSTDEGRIEALNKWHGFVIDDAKSKGEMELAKLENEALVSGIGGIADFKKDIKNFEKDFEVVEGFVQVLKVKIGPLVPGNIGGVYVIAYQRTI